MDEKSSGDRAMRWGYASALIESFVPHRICWPAYWQRVDTVHSIAPGLCQPHAGRL